MLLGIVLWLALAGAALVGIGALLGGSVMVAFRSWRLAGLIVFGAGLLGAIGAVVLLVLLALVTTGTLKYVGSEAWIIFPLAGFAALGFPALVLGLSATWLRRWRARRAAAV
jgi:hypothetical protein